MAIIFNTKSNTLLSGTSGNDTIANGEEYEGGGDNVTINAGKGNDSITNNGYEVIINAGAGNDSVTNDGDVGDDVTIDGGAGKDYIYNSGGYFNGVKIEGGKGNDTIVNDVGDHDMEEGSSGINTISGGDGNDYIKNYYVAAATISGGTGNDTIENYGHATISGGAGNDLISLKSSSYGRIIQYADGDGNDTIVGFKSSDTLHITEGSYTTVKSGKDLIVKVGKGSILLKKAPSDVLIYNGEKVIYGSVKNNRFNDVTLAGSKKADTIGNSAQNVLITGGAGNDSITNYGYYSTITGGKGNDLISLRSISTSENIIQYASGDGNDTIFGFNSDDTLQITAGNYLAEESGNDVVITVGKSKITLKNSVGQEISIKNSKGKVITKTFSSNVAELFDSTNFVTADNISEIVANKSVADFENISTEKISHENLITFAK